MGNLPSRWTSRALSLLGALVSGGVGLLLGRFLSRKLAYGFVFDWYVHPPETSFPMSEALVHIGATAAVAAFLAALTTVGIASWSTQAQMRRARYAPPRYPHPSGVDVFGARLVLLLTFGLAILAPATVYVILSAPLAQGGAAVDELAPDDFVLIYTAVTALASFAAALATSLAVHAGLVSGRVVPKSDRNLIARVSIFGMRNAKTTVALVLAITAVAGVSASSITTNVDVADVLPRGDPNTIAAHNLTDEFKSSFTQQVTFQFRVLDSSNLTQRELYIDENAQKLPNRATEADVDNITDEMYVRAMSEATDFILSQEPFAGSIGSPDFYKLINWTIEGGNGGPDSAFAIPPTTPDGELRYASVEAGVRNVSTVFAAVDAVTSPDWKQTAVLITVSGTYNGSAKHIGERALEVRDAWVEKVRGDPDLFQAFGPANPPQFTVDLPIANAHASELTSHDFRLLLPVIALFIAVTLFIAFRNAVSVIATFSMLAVATTWTFGVMGAMRIPLNTINLATVPLIMGVGIDYGIHMMNEYQELRARGKTPEEAWAHAGGGSALALFVGMLTTVAGLVVMIVSPSLLVAQLGLLATIAMFACYTLAIVFIPALVTLVGERRKTKQAVGEYRPSSLMPNLAKGVSRGRWAVAFVMLLLSAAALASASGIHREAFGDPPRNWLEGDPLREEHLDALQGFYASPTDDIKANVLIIEGNIADPAVHDYINGITRTLRSFATNDTWTDPRDNSTHESRVIADTLRDLPFLLNTYLTVKDGVPGAGQFLGAQALKNLFDSRGMGDPTGRTDTYPKTEAELRAIMDEVMDSPLRNFANLFVNTPEYDMTVIVFSVEAATYDDAEAVWWEVQAALAANEAIKPEGVSAAFFGNTAINYLFVAKQVPWLGYMSIATVIIVSIIVFAFTRNLRTTLLVTTLNALTSALWIGVLPVFGIGLAINLTLPLIFIYCMGSDYALHLGMRCAKTKDTYATFEGVGKGVLYSFITTFGAFLVFTQISDYAGRRGMIATAIAIGVVFLATLLIVPIFYPVRKGQDKGSSGKDVPIVETRAALETAASAPGR